MTQPVTDAVAQLAVTETCRTRCQKLEKGPGSVKERRKLSEEMGFIWKAFVTNLQFDLFQISILLFQSSWDERRGGGEMSYFGKSSSRLGTSSLIV